MSSKSFLVIELLGEDKSLGFTGFSFGVQEINDNHIIGDAVVFSSDLRGHLLKDTNGAADGLLGVGRFYVEGGFDDGVYVNAVLVFSLGHSNGLQRLWTTEPQLGAGADRL